MFILFRERALNTGLILVQYFNNLQHKLLMYDEENVYNMKKKVIKKIITILRLSKR